jgi:hypothetical protein
MSSRRAVLILLAMLVAVTVFMLFRAPAGSRAVNVFNPQRTADLEVDMWKAYYEKENVRLFNDLVTMLHEQYRYSWAQASITGFYLARPAARFATMQGNYEQVLPDLERAYARIRTWTGAAFDPQAVARAELAWWVARRDPAARSPEHVGRLIAEENALIFGRPVNALLEASVLRARAGRLRDDGGERADWQEVSRLLHASWSQLHQAVQ